MKNTAAQQISTLAAGQLQPLRWRITKSVDKKYQLEFTFAESVFENVRTRRNEIKQYKTLDSLIRDIERVQKDALIHYHA